MPIFLSRSTKWGWEEEVWNSGDSVVPLGAFMPSVDGTQEIAASLIIREGDGEGDIRLGGRRLTCPF